MKVFKVSASGFSYDDFVSIVIVAEDKDKALEIAKQGHPYDWKDPDKHKIYWNFEPEQFPLIVEEISLKREQVVVSEYYGS